MKKKIIKLLGTAIAISLFGGALGIAASGEENPYKATADGYFHSDCDISVEYGAIDSRGLKGADLTLTGLDGKSEAEITYNNYMSTSDLKDGFLTLSFDNPTEYGKADFDYLFVEVSDAINPDEKLIWAIAPQPDTCGWWDAWTSAWISGISELEATTRAAWTYPALLKVAGTEQMIFGYNTSFVNQYNVLYDGGAYYDAGYNFGAKTMYFVKESEDVAVMNSLTFGLNETQATINKKVIANIANTEWLQDSGSKLIGTKYENVYTEERMSNLFSSGYCTLKIRYMGLNSDSITCHIKKIGEQVLADQVDYKVKNGTPLIQINNRTHAVVGVGYPLPTATITDRREGDISQNVQYRFFDVAGDEIVYTGSEVLFPKPGEYSMKCYVTLSDGSTFINEKLVNCYAEMPTTEFEINATIKGSYFTGDVLEIPNVVAHNLLATTKDFSVEPIVVLQRNGSEIARFNGSQFNYYTIEKDGEYVLAYLYCNEYGIIDFCSFAFTAEKTISVTPDYLPISFTSGQANFVASCSLFDYVKRVESDEIYWAVYVNNEQIYTAKGKECVSGSLQFTKTFETASATLTYKAGYSLDALNYEFSYEIPVIQATYTEDYVIVTGADGTYARDNVTSIISDSSVIFEVNEDTTFTLPQRIYADGMELAFDVMAGSSFEYLEVVFADFINPSKKVVFTAKPASSGTELSINGKDAGTIGLSFASDADYFHAIYECDDVNNRLIDTYGNSISSKIAKIDTWSNGMPFDGYTDGTCAVSFAIKGVSGTSKFALMKVNNQAFFTETIGDSKQPFSDFSPPVLYVHGKYKTSYSLGDKVTLYRAEAFDVMKNQTYITITVEKPDGTIYYQGAANVDMPLLLSEYGDWLVTYSAHDGNDWFAIEEHFVFNVVDAVDPIVTVSQDLPKHLAISTTYTFPEAQVFDNVTQNCEYYVIVSRPDGMREAAEGNQYTFTMKGLYTVSYYTMDEYMNVAQKTYYIWVE